MSAYVVEDRTIDRILTYLTMDAEAVPSLLPRVAAAAGARPGDASAIGRALLAMNVRAVNARYSEHAAAPAYTWTPAMADDAQYAKSLDCYMYQCSEGDVPDEPLYAAMEHVRRFLGADLVRRLPDYEEAEWG